MLWKYLNQTKETNYSLSHRFPTEVHFKLECLLLNSIVLLFWCYLTWCVILRVNRFSKIWAFNCCWTELPKSVPGFFNENWIFAFAALLNRILITEKPLYFIAGWFKHVDFRATTNNFNQARPLNYCCSITTLSLLHSFL